MNPAAAEVSRLLRAERTAVLAERLRAGDFAAARYESTPRKRAEVLAQVLMRTLSRGALRRRLKRLGVALEFQRGALQAVSVEGGGLDVRGANGRGQVLTGEGIDQQLLAVFPELLPHTLTNLTFVAGPGASNTTLNVANPLTSGTNASSWDLTLFLPSYTPSAAVERALYTVTCGPGTVYTVAFTAPFCSVSGVTITCPSTAGLSDLAWNATGLNWIEINSGRADPAAGDKTYSFSIVNAPATWNCSCSESTLTITYTAAGCLTCELTLQVNSICDGLPIGGGVFALSNGLSCTQNGAGVCTISGIPNGVHSWTWTKIGYGTLTGSYTCECAGGSSTLVLSPTPNGGCGGGIPTDCTFLINVHQDCPGNAPIVGATVQLSTGESGTTDAGGALRLTGLVCANRNYTVTAVGYGTATGSLTYSGVALQEVSLVLQRLPTVGCTGTPGVSVGDDCDATSGVSTESGSEEPATGGISTASGSEEPTTGGIGTE